MSYSKRTTIFKQILFSRWTALAIIFAIVFVGYGLFSVIQKSMHARASRTRAENEALAIQNKEAELSKKLAVLDTKEGKEAVLREQFSVVREGEHVVVITDAPKTASISTTAPTSSKGFWNFLKGLFGK